MYLQKQSRYSFLDPRNFPLSSAKNHMTLKTAGMITFPATPMWDNLEAFSRSSAIVSAKSYDLRNNFERG